MIKKVLIRVGSVVHVRDAYPYSLPDGLADGGEVVVLSYDRRTYSHLVRDREGQEWSIAALQNLDAGNEYMVDARWLREDHPDGPREVAKERKSLTSTLLELDVPCSGRKGGPMS